MEIIEMNDLFDISDTDDLPKEIAEELVVNTRDPFELNINQLFLLARDQGLDQLNIDQITVAYYRQFVKNTFNAESKSRKQIALKISNMIRGHKPLIESIPERKGVYRLKKDGTKIRFKRNLGSLIHTEQP